MTDTVSPVDMMLNDIAKSMEEWAVDQRASIGTKVTQRLDKHRDDILMKLLGFDKDSFAGDVWKIDHCNGRNGNSPIGDFLKTSQEVTVKEWVAQIPLPKMTPAFKARITKQLQSTYESEISARVRGMAWNKADTDLQELLDTVCQPTLLEKIKMTHSLIIPTTTTK